MMKRDQAILKLLKHFRVLSRDQLGNLVCPDVARPWVTVNRIMKRLSRDGWITTVPRPREQQYLYMPNPTLIHPQSSKTQHFLGLVDLYLELGRPEIYEVEPKVSDEYIPDAYCRIRASDPPFIIELQRSYISHSKMQEKVMLFADTYKAKKHDAKTLWIVSDYSFNIKVPHGLEVVQKKATSVS